MRSAVLATFVALLASAPVAAQQADGLSADDKEAVTALLQRFAVGNPITGPDDFFGVFAEDAHFNFRGNVRNGIKEIRTPEGWCGTISGENTVEHLEGSGDLAYAIGKYRLSLDCGAEEPFKPEGSFISVFRRGPDGSWLIAAWVASPPSTS